MDNLTNKDLFEYAWKHFTVIADQRMKTFNFYVILLAASTGATLTVFERMNKTHVILACGFMHMLFATIFFLIDQRSRRLIAIPKQVFFTVETAKGWRLFLEDAEQMKSRWNKVISYTAAFRLSFAIQFCFGLWILISALAG